MPQPDFDVTEWAASLLFPDTCSVQPGGTGGEVGEHGARRRVECPDCSARFEYGAQLAEVGGIRRGEREHQVPQNLLDDIERSHVG